jgi:hypothetical protein
MKNAYKILIKKREVMASLERHRRKWKDVKQILKNTGYGGGCTGTPPSG